MCVGTLALFKMADSISKSTERMGAAALRLPARGCAGACPAGLLSRRDGGQEWAAGTAALLAPSRATQLPSEMKWERLNHGEVH